MRGTTSPAGHGRLAVCPRFALLLLQVAVLSACQGGGESPEPLDGPEIPPAPGEVRIPEASDWTDAGMAITAGPDEAWDTRLSGALSPATVIKTGGTYFLYYIGADGDRETPPGDDGGPRHRALGVATSQDGIEFTKYGGNPVLTFRPTPDGINAQEEGVFSAAAASDSEQITVFFGGMTMSSDTGVRIDIYRTTSADGLTFEEPAKALDGETPEVWGNDGQGNEITPAGLFRRDGTWNLYYLTKNRETGNDEPSETWDYGLAKASQGGPLDGTHEVLLQEDSTLGGQYRQLSVVEVNPDSYALFLINFDPEMSKTRLELRMVNATRPDELSGPRVAYEFPDKVYAIVFLDEAAGKWFMYHRLEDEPDAPIRVKTAPVQYVQE